MQTATLSQSMMRKAEKLAELVPTFTRGREKQTGIEYVIVPSSDDPEHTGHTTNGLKCSCDGFDRRGICTHATAVTLWHQRQEAARIAVAQQQRRENGRCSQKGCLFTATTKLGRCEDHARVILALVADL